MSRHLPVLQPSATPPTAPRAPDGAGWTAAGVLVTLLIWVVLARLGQEAIARLPHASSGWTALIPPIVSFVLAAFAGGAVVGAFGPQGVLRPAVASGALSAAFAWVVAVLRFPWEQAIPVLIAAVVIGALCSLSGCIAVRKRRPPAKAA